MSTGMVLGKFFPPHHGHLYLINFARRYVDDLTVIVGTLAAESIAGELRYQWMKQLCPDVRVLHLTDENPQYPDEHPEFWNIWRRSLERILPAKPDAVFASEAYGGRLARELGAEFVPVDPLRAIVPVSGTVVRDDPWAHWEFLPDPVKAHYAIRVCVFGPESTGKSTLARNLAQRFRTIHVPEYARTLLEAKGGELSASDFPRIVRGQIASEEALAARCNRVLFCDTDVLMTKIWSQMMTGACSAPIVAAASTRNYDLYLVTDVDVPWVDDRVRYLPEDRRSFFDRCISELESLGRSYVRVCGDWDKRLETACAAVQRVLRNARTQKRIAERPIRPGSCAPLGLRRDE